ncbi:MAG: polyketide synthase, partial [Pseudomonadota bacterium]
GDALGAGLLAALLCDLLVLGEGGSYGFTDAGAGLWPSAGELSLCATRLGVPLAEDLLYATTTATGAALRARGWTCAVAADATVQVASWVEALRSKSSLSLALLKRHLSRDLSAAVEALVPAGETAIRADAPTAQTVAASLASDFPHLSIEADARGVVHVRLRVAGRAVTAEAVFADLAALFARLHRDAHRAVVLSSDGPEFLPGSRLPAVLLQTFRSMVAAAPQPVIAALEGGARGGAWLAALCCDGVVHADSGRFSTDGMDDGASLRLAAAVFPQALDREAARTLLATGEAIVGAALRTRAPGSRVAPSRDTLRQALALAARCAMLPESTLADWKTWRAQAIEARLASLPTPAGHEDAVADTTAAGAPSRIALASTVVSATAWPDGVVLVEMADRDARNMFSDALRAGMAEAFAHIAATPGYRTVVLSGYDRCFSSGGTRENLLAIQSGDASFTDYRIFETARQCPLPVIAAMQGHGIGAGWTLGMLADAIVLGAESRYLSPYMHYGFTPGAGATWVLGERLGRDLANESLLTAEPTTGAALRARGAGIPVLPGADAVAAALAMAHAMARAGRATLIERKRLLSVQADAALAETYRLELAMHERTFVGDAGTLARIEHGFAAETAPVVVAPSSSASSAVASAAVASTASATASADRGGIAATLRALLAQALHLSEDEIDDDTQFVDLGLDSISGVTWIRRINAHYGTSIEATRVYRHPTLAQFARHIAELVQGGAPSPATIAEPAPVSTTSSQTILPATPAGADADAVRATLRALLAQALHLAEDEVDDDTQFVDLGLDSISGVTWIRRINAQYGTSIEATRVYRYPTLAQFAAHVATLLGPAPASSGNPVAAETAPVSVPSAQPAATVASDLDAVQATLRALLAQALHLSEDEIDPDAQFVDLGLDSISGVTWVRRINAQYGTTIEAPRVYRYPTLARFARHVHETIGGAAMPSTPSRQLEPVASAAMPVAASTEAFGPALDRFAVPSLSPRRRTGARVATAAVPSPIAIVGMAGQFPQARDLDTYWRNLAEGRDCIVEVPAERWNMAAHYRAGDPVAGKANSKWMGALEDYDRFDPLFFNLSPTEAEIMDPQQRLFLQACWQGIEHAGYDARALSGTRCGVFVGCTTGDYHHLSPEHLLSAQGFTGGAISILAARIAYGLNLQGPCLSIDTACSSSLVAIATACDSLAAGNSDIALAGGVYVMAGPELHIKTSQAGMLSGSGRCFTFDQRADGFVPGEGVGVAMLKRLADAERDGDVVHAVIEAWGVNQDGKTNGITAPNPDSQARLEQEVYDRFGIDPAGIQLIEAHGTGTKLGDPIEVEGLKLAFAKYTRNVGYCALGSVKSNIGHCATAAGIAGVIKLALAIRHRQLPPTIHYERLNEHIELADSPFYVNDRLRPWTTTGGARRRAAVSSFGFSGTNAHLVIAEPAAGRPTRTAPAAPMGEAIVPLSAKTPEQLRQKVVDLIAFLRGEGANAALADIAYTLQVGREPMDERLGVIASGVDDLAARLQAWVDGASGAKDCLRGHARQVREVMSVLGRDEDLQEAVIARCIAARKWSGLVELWVKGIEFDWNRLYGETRPRRMALPVYPFARERYWIATGASMPASAGAPASTRSPALHPLVHENTSDLAGQRYTSTFDGDEFFLADHRVAVDAGAPRPVLPGVAYLEMARAAVERALPPMPGRGDDAVVGGSSVDGTSVDGSILELRNVVWAQPIFGDGGVRVHIALSTDDGCEVDYEIHGDDSVVHGQGRVVVVPRPQRTTRDIAAMKARADGTTVGADALYAGLAGMGLHYGPAHRGIVALTTGRDEVFAHLRLPAPLVDGHARFGLHPSLADSALQACVGLVCDPQRLPERPLVPFALDAMRTLAPCEPEMTAWLRRAAGSRPGDRVLKLDIDLCDAQGRVCVEFRGFAARVMETGVGGMASDDDFDLGHYERLVEDIANRRLSVDEAVALE